MATKEETHDQIDIEGRIAEAWEVLGGEVQAMNDVVYVRTDVPDRITPGGIIKAKSNFWDGLPSPPRGDAKTVWAVVCSAGPDATVERGDRVFFERIFFAWSARLSDDARVGWIRDKHLLVRWEPDE